MSKEDKFIPGIIPENEYVPELEDDVKFHVARILAGGVAKVTKKYTHIEYPDFGTDIRARQEWQLSEIDKCINGFGGLPGKYYYYFNHCKIEHKARGLIRPDFRTIDLEWFKFVEEQQKSNKYGIVCIKRRQIGQSWKAAADILHDCTFNTFFKVGMNSKSEEDSRMMFENVKLIHQELPDFLRPVATASNRRDKMVFARKDKDAAGNPKMVGTQSSIISVAPTITAHAGKRYAKLVIDEAGEQCWGEFTLIKMADGSNKYASEVIVGDKVMGINSEPLEVIATTVGESEMYRVTPTTGEPFECNGNHLLTVKFNGRADFINIPVKDFIKLDPLKQRYYQLVKTGVEYPKQNYFFDPYWFGLWLGDGSSDKPGVVSMDREIQDYLEFEAPTLHNMESSVYNIVRDGRKPLKYCSLKSNKFRVKVTEHNDKEEYFKNTAQLCDYYNISFRAYQQFVTGQKIATYKPHKNRGYHLLSKYVKDIQDITSSPTIELKKLGVYGNKHIPECYLKTSREDRLKLLAGIIDTDGSKDHRKDRYEITLALPQFARDVQELCLSLGFNASYNIRTVNYNYKDGSVRNHYRIGITGNNLNEIPCRLPRKKVQKESIKRKGRRDPMKSGFKVEPIGKGTYYGFQLDKSPYFLLGDYTIAHNCDLLPMWGKTEPCITQDAIRTGAVQIFGTVGDITKNGKGLQEFWTNHKAYDLKQFGIWGYNAMFVDEYGNDLLEHAVRFIIYKRKALEGAAKRVRNEFIQAYPLNSADAFLNVNVSGIGNPQIITNQYLKLLDNPPEKRIGKMRRNIDGSVDFVPDPNGSVVVYELPDPTLKNAYVAGGDPVDHDNVEKTRDTSNLALAILAKPHGVQPPRIVLELVGRPAKVEEWFREAAMCLQWFNMTKVLVEDNRARMVNYFEQNFPELLAMTPRSINSVKKGVELKYGIKMTAERKEQLLGLIEDMLDNYADFIPSIRFLDECRGFGGDHAEDDFLIAVGWALVLLQADKKPVKTVSETSEGAPKAIFKKQNGVITYINQGTSKQKPKFSSGSVLFRR